MASTIGIKLANGEFFSILEENIQAKKRLVVTTVHDNQHSMQIDLYRSYTKTMADALYIGSIVVENIISNLMGAPSIELIISSTMDGVISAYASDLDPGSAKEQFHLSVSLRSLDEDSREDEIPDYELEEMDSPPEALFENPPPYRARSRMLLWIILAGVVLLLGGLCAWFFLLRKQPARRREAEMPIVVSAPAPSQDQAAAPEESPAAEPAPAAPAPIQAEAPAPAASVEAPAPAVPILEAAPPAPQAPRARNRPPAPVSSYNVPAVIPREGVSYTIRWGDTLWEISEAFYRNPWLYPRIAQYNRIPNPDLIISGTTIRIPPRE